MASLVPARQMTPPACDYGLNNTLVWTIRANSRQHSQQHLLGDAPRASQTPPLSLTFPKSAAHHHRAAVQSNEVYPTPPASVRRVNFGGRRINAFRSKHVDQGKVKCSREGQR